MTDKNDTIPFPPIVQRTKLLEDIRTVQEKQMTAAADLTNEQVRWVTRINAITVKICSTPEGKKDLRDRILAVGLPYIKACAELGREIYGDEWDEGFGPHFMATTTTDVTSSAVCPECISGDHEPHFEDE